MKQFDFEKDYSTIYMKSLNILGYLLLGFAIGIITYKFKLGEPINWMHIAPLFIFGLVFTLFPLFSKLPTFKVNDQGFFFKNHKVHKLERKTISWDKVSSIQVKKDHLSIEKTAGPKEEINLPNYSKKQVNDLKSYLKEISFQKDVNYLE